MLRRKRKRHMHADVGNRDLDNTDVNLWFPITVSAETVLALPGRQHVSR